MLDKYNEWCNKVNGSKTNIVHFRNKKHAKTNVRFTLGDGSLETEYLDFDECAEFSKNSDN